MNRTERRLFWRTIGLGLVLTLVVICADGLGLLDQLERYLYDFRAQNFQTFTPKPTDQLVHLDIDDPSADQLGAFPWPRTQIADMIDEIKLAGAKVIGMDIIFPEPQRIRYEKKRDGTYKEIRDDENLADSIRRADNVLIPVSVQMLEPGEHPPTTTQPARLEEFTLPRPPDAPAMLRAETELKTIPRLLDAIRYSAVVEFLQDPDSVVRSVPLFVNYRGRMMPHMSLATTCAQLGVSIKDIQISSNAVTIPMKGSPPIVIPVRTIRSSRFGRVGMFMNIPWIGASGPKSWLTQFDYPQHKDSKQHVSLNTVWQICQNLELVRKDAMEVDDALKSLIQINPSPKLAAFLEHLDEQTRWELIESNLKELADFAKPLEVLPAGEEFLAKLQDGDLPHVVVGDQLIRLFLLRKPEEEKLIGAYRGLQAGLEARNLQALIEKQRAVLKAQLDGKCALIGWTATGKTDAYATSLDPLCPGVAMQGVVFNAIVTRHFWRVAPWWISALTTLVLGLLTTLVVARFSIWPALLCTFAVVGGYLIVNGLVLFDYAGIIVTAGAPIVGATCIWFGVTVARFLYEQAERSRITQRFSDYVDPMVVNHFVQNPEAVRFDGQVKEISVVFTDLEGFTSLSEKLREKTVPMLNEYMSLMLPIIRENQGYWNKFLGDGIMFFFNAPGDNERHARDAVLTVLNMQNAMVGFNRKLIERNLPPVAMRAGISTGMMVVGDAGSTDPVHRASDYTVLGDEVNLGARLESANKALDTRVLTSGRTAELASAHILFRPIGRIQVVGKTEGVMTHEALCTIEQANESQKKLVELSGDVVKRFGDAAFDACIAAARELESQFGKSKFSALYMSLCQQYLQHPPGNGFDGTIVLAQK